MKDNDDFTMGLNPIKNSVNPYFKKEFFSRKEHLIKYSKYRIPLGKSGKHPYLLDIREAQRILIIGLTRCLDYNTRVFTNNGIKRLKEINSNVDKLISWDFNLNKKVESEFIKYDIQEQEVYEIKFESGKKILATKDHLFFDKDKNEIKVEDIKQGDDLLSIKNEFTPEVIEKIRQTSIGRKYPNRKPHPKVTVETRKKLSKALKGKKRTLEQRKRISKSKLNYFKTHSSPTLGKKMSLKSKLKLKMKMIGKYDGEKNPFYGKKHTNKTKIHLRKQKIGKKLTIEHKEKIRLGCIGKQKGILNGMFGKHLSKKAKKKISKATSGENNPMFGVSPSFKPIMYHGVKFRSKWEIEYAKLFDDNNIVWEFEKHKFKFINYNGKWCSYTPDFYLPQFNKYVEVKGWFPKECLRKFQTFIALYPNTILVKSINEKDKISLLEKLNVIKN